MFQACFMASKLDEVNVKEQLSVSSRRPEDVKILRVVLFVNRGRCWEYSYCMGLQIIDWICFIYKELFCFEGRGFVLCRGPYSLLFYQPKTTRKFCRPYHTADMRLNWSAKSAENDGVCSPRRSIVYLSIWSKRDRDAKISDFNPKSGLSKLVF